MSWVCVSRELCVDSPVPGVALVGTALRIVSVTMEEPALPLQESVFAVQATLGRGETRTLLFLKMCVYSALCILAQKWYESIGMNQYSYINLNL